MAYPSRVPLKSQPGTRCQENETLDLKQMDEVAFRTLLQSQDSEGLKAPIRLKKHVSVGCSGAAKRCIGTLNLLKVLRHLADQSAEWRLANQEIGRLLVLPAKSRQCDGARSINFSLP